METLCYLLSHQFFFFFYVINKKTEVTLAIMCNILDIISVSFVFNEGSLSHQMMCFRKRVLSLVAQVKIRDAFGA